MAMKARATALAILTACILPGCAMPENDRATIGQTMRPEALTPAVRPAPATTPIGAAPAGEPSVIGLDRSHWAATRVHVPVDGTAHGPTYAKRLHSADRTARQRGEYPDAGSALELTDGSLWQQQGEALANHGFAALDTLLIIPRLIWSPPWRERWSPDVAYERSWQADRPVFPEPAEAPLEDPFTMPTPHPVTP